MKRQERIAHFVRGTLIRDEGTFLFRRQWPGEETFEDYDINVEDLAIVIVDASASLFLESETDTMGVIDDATAEIIEVMDIERPELSGIELLVELSEQNGTWVVYSASASVNDIGPTTQEPAEALLAWIRKEVNDPAYEVCVTNKGSDTYGIFVRDRVPLEKFLDGASFDRRLATVDIDAIVAEKVMGMAPVRKGVRIPKYSTDMNDAMLVIQAISEKDNCCIKLDLDVPGGVWGVTVKGNSYRCETKVFYERPAELPMVICLAALKLVGVKI